MPHFRSAKAFLHCSSTAVYQPNGHRAFREDDELGDNHRVMSFMPTYSINKIAAEAKQHALIGKPGALEGRDAAHGRALLSPRSR